MTTKFEYTGRSAIVTGGAQGIGRAVVETLLAGGASVAIWDRDKALADATAAELKGRGTVIAVAVDVADAPSVENGYAETVRQLGKVDILVNNAGIAGLNAKVADYPIDEWDKILLVNLRSQFLCCRAVIPGMIKQNYGRIANVASVAGKEGNPTAAAYSASKAGVIALTKSLGKEVAEFNIAVNAISPSAAKTSILEQVSEQHIAYMLSKVPRGRFVTVDEVATMIGFMVSEENSFTTAATFDISGGRTTF